MLTVELRGKPLSLREVLPTGEGLRLTLHDPLNAGQWWELVLPLDTLLTAVAGVQLAQQIPDVDDVDERDPLQQLLTAFDHLPRE